MDVFEKFQRSPLNPLKGSHLTVSGLIPLGNKRACEGKEKKPVFLVALITENRNPKLQITQLKI